MRYNKHGLFLTHYPTFTGEKNWFVRCILNLYGRISKQISSRPTMYYVGVDSHACKPVLLDDAITEMREAFMKKSQLYSNEPN